MKKAQVDPRLVAAGLIVIVIAGAIALYFSQQKKLYPDYPLKYDEKMYFDAYKDIGDRAPDLHVADKTYIDRFYDGIESSLIMFNNFPDDPLYQVELDRVVRLMDVVRSRMTDSDGDGHLDFVSAYTYGKTMYTHGSLTQLFVDTAAAIRKNKVEKYYDKATQYENLADNDLIPYMLRVWKPYEVNGRVRGYFAADDGTAIPYNQASPGTLAILERGLSRNNPDLMMVAQRYANRYFDLNQIRDQNGTRYLSAKYYLYDNQSGEVLSSRVTNGLTDMTHLNFEFEFVQAAFENNLVSRDNYGLIINALHVMELQGRVRGRDTPIFNQNMQPPRKVYPDERLNIFEQTGFIYNMIRFGIVDQPLFYDFEEILRDLIIDGQLSGAYYSSYYKCVQDPRYNYQEFCSQNVDPSTGAFAYQIEDMSTRRAIANLMRFNQKGVFG